MIRSCSASQSISRERRTLFHKLCHRSKTKDCVWAMHRLVQLSVQDWLAESQENRRVATTRVRVCGGRAQPYAKGLMSMNSGATLESFLATGSIACIRTCTKVLKS